MGLTVDDPCPNCGNALQKTDLDTAKLSLICTSCAPEFVQASALDDYDGPYSRYQ